MTRCLLIQMPAVGYDVIDHRAAAEFGIAVATPPATTGTPVADWTVMAILNLGPPGVVGRPGDARRRWPKPEMAGSRAGRAHDRHRGAGQRRLGLATRLLAFGSRVLYTDIVERSVPASSARPSRTCSGELTWSGGASVRWTGDQPHYRRGRADAHAEGRALDAGDAPLHDVRVEDAKSRMRAGGWPAPSDVAQPTMPIVSAPSS